MAEYLRCPDGRTIRVEHSPDSIGIAGLDPVVARAEVDRVRAHFKAIYERNYDLVMDAHREAKS